MTPPKSVHFINPSAMKAFRWSSLALRRKPLISERRNLWHAHDDEAASHRPMAAIASVGEIAIAFGEFSGRLLPRSHRPVPEPAVPSSKDARKSRLNCRQSPCVRSRTQHPTSAVRKKAQVQTCGERAQPLLRREISGACRTGRVWPKPPDDRRKKPRDPAGEAESARRCRRQQPASVR